MRRLALLAVVLAGCGGEDEPPPSAGAPIPSGGLSIAQAQASNLDGPLTVVGHLAERDDVLRLCDGLRESYPPQCVDPSLRIDGDVDAEIGERVSIVGKVDGDVLRVSETSR